MKKWIAFILALAICFSASGCGENASTIPVAQAADLMDGIQPNAVTPMTDLSEYSPTVADFGVRLFQNSMKAGKNTLISPLSVLVALSMTANGADGETLTQMEQVLGLPSQTLNEYVYSYMSRLPEEAKYKLRLANAIWFKDDEKFTVEQSFLQTNADYYGADAYKTPFDESTLNEINQWADTNTDGMIDRILDNIPDEAVMYLVNALAFDAEWENIYEKYQIRDGVFTTEDDVEQDIELMYSEEYNYLEDENATGVIKYYADKKYAFAALLPNEGVTVEEYVNSLTGEHLLELLSEPTQIKTYTAIPKFETEYDVEMSGILADMGMPNAFDWGAADFSRLGAYDADGVNLVLNRVLHKTFISVDERGTKAGAVTAIEVAEKATMLEEETKSVILDRPFVYMLIDCENNIPFFIGTMMDVTGETERADGGLEKIPSPILENEVIEIPDCTEEPIVYCGNTWTTVYMNDQEYSFMGGDSVTLTDLLINLDYDPLRVCKCLPTVTVDTEFGTGYGLNLADGYARCEDGQASLTQEQIETIQQILDRLE